MSPPLSSFSLFLFCLLCSSVFLLSSTTTTTNAFQSDELLLDDEEFGLEGGRSPLPDLDYVNPSSSPSTPLPNLTPKRRSSDHDSDSKVQFTLEHAFGNSDFFPAGTFTARLKTSIHGGQTLTKLRFSRNPLSEIEKEDFKRLLNDDEFYRIRLPSNVLSPPGKDYITSSVKARCLPREGLDEHFVIHMESVNILAVNYGSPGACQYPRSLKLPSKWSFNSYTILKNSEQAPRNTDDEVPKSGLTTRTTERAPAFAEEILGVENIEGEDVKPPEKSLWAKYWMYLIPLVLIVMNAITQVMNMPEEQGAGASGSQVQQGTAQRAPAVRRR